MKKRQQHLAILVGCVIGTIVSIMAWLALIYYIITGSIYGVIAIAPIAIISTIITILGMIAIGFDKTEDEREI